MSKEFEFELLNDVKLPSVIAEVLGQEILEKGVFKTKVIKVIDYLKSLGHKINNVLDYIDDGEDNDSQPELTEIAKDIVTKGKKAKKEVAEKVEIVEEIVEEAIETAKEIKEEVEEVVEKVADIKKEMTSYFETALEAFFHKHVAPMEAVIESINKDLLTKVDKATIKKEFIDSLNKKLNKANTDSANTIKALAVLSNRVTDLEKAPAETTEYVNKAQKEAVEEAVEEVKEEVIAIPLVPEEKPSLKEQAEELDLDEVDQEKLDKIKDLSEKGLE